jgi:purine-nucleoside phosphorylase
MAAPCNPKPCAALLRRLTPLRPAVAVVLGSGFSHVLDALKPDAVVPYSKLPGFPPVGVHGHAGRLVVARVGRVPVAFLAGRAHYYEGHAMEVVTFATRVLVEWGVKALLLTNAAGGVNPRFRPGDFMRLTDHINFMGVNPLRGAPVPSRERFVDLSRVYDPSLGRLLERAGRAAGTRVRRGVYLAVSGPSYETPAEVRAYRRLGADAVGMSTVPEAIVARQCGLRVAGLSCISNLAAGLQKTPLSHAEVLETAERVKPQAARLLLNFLGLYGKSEGH